METARTHHFAGRTGSAVPCICPRTASARMRPGCAKEPPCAEERAPREMEYTEVQEEIRQQILREKIQSRQKAWLEAQWKEADVQILDQRLKKGAVEGERMS